MKFGVITFPGSNCDQDMIYVLETIMGFEVERLWHKDSSLKGADFIVLPGGFSYGDYLRSGAIASFSPIMKEVIAHAENGGYVLGICNGFQILCESKLLPGTLLHNDHQKFTCKNVYLKADNNASLINQGVGLDEVLKIPIAHAEGRFFAPDDLLSKIEHNNQVIYRYCDAEGNVTDEANPNGTLNNIAGVCNVGRNVFGMMPHPERAADLELGNIDGLRILESLVREVLV
ncbi:MAG: phosphoribosylformylglycinamidine synthase subunit PurQ [Bacteroidetes bacterium]|nr:MAG: phosphoribosylformylglycinamidine synthase subunit PurQ [Bacteroidota bacterium]MBL1143615.1 phosphoribosylformylglycinamidine synthase subunit PurQ [Bacteroidota bacterium]NOG56417.1 phosphoribosylformylglycinamidine synthase subunit PurQ [Bacteroidota bacterium]